MEQNPGAAARAGLKLKDFCVFSFGQFSRLTVAGLPQPPNPLRRGLQMTFQGGEAFTKSAIESRLVVQAAQIG